MAQITLKGTPIHTCQELPPLNQTAPDFVLVTQDLENKTLSDFKGRRKLIATVPSLDTEVCSLMTKRLNDLAKEHPDQTFLVVSADLPFAQKRFCKAEGVSNLITLSSMRNQNFGKEYGLLISDGPLEGLLARSLLILNENNQILYTQLVPEIAQEPNYQEASTKLNN